MLTRRFGSPRDARLGLSSICTSRLRHSARYRYSKLPGTNSGTWIDGHVYILCSVLLTAYSTAAACVLCAVGWATSVVTGLR